MRFKRGTKVEVLSKKEVPSGSWRCAEIVSGNGHNYHVRYDWSPGATDALVERVSRKVIRPYPPPVEGVKDWVSGDLVEVFDGVSWKIGIVSKVMGGNYFLIRLVGFSQKFRAHKSGLRVRQSWQDDEWGLVGMGAGICEDGKSNKRSNLRHYQKLSCQLSGTDRKMKLNAGDNCFPVENNIGFQESHMISSRSLKRGSPYGSFHVDAYMGAGQKTRVIEKDGRRQRMVPGHPSPLLEKVDAVASPRNKLGEKYMHASFYNRIGFSELDSERAKPNGDFGCSISRSLEPNDADDSACSVGSCSITSNSPFRLRHHSLSNSIQDLDSHFSDAESFCGSGYKKECALPSKEDLAREIHKLELNAYRCTMVALYASGPLSWEQEALVTNLRLTLHISNDEHLMELKSLVSS